MFDGYVANCYGEWRVSRDGRVKGRPFNVIVLAVPTMPNLNTIGFGIRPYNKHRQVQFTVCCSVTLVTVFPFLTALLVTETRDVFSRSMFQIDDSLWNFVQGHAGLSCLLITTLLSLITYSLPLNRR